MSTEEASNWKPGELLRFVMTAGLKCFIAALVAVLASGLTTCSFDERQVEQSEIKGSQEPDSVVTFVHEPNVLRMLVDDQQVADYIYHDPVTIRPYFAQVRSLSGIRVTRNRPPFEGQDLMDHRDMHPGIWMSFGDFCGNDYWRLKSPVEHERFIRKPEGGESVGSFGVRNYYLDESGENRLAQEDAYYQLRVLQEGYLLIQQSVFKPYGESEEIVFGDQEEMGFSVRLDTPLVEQFGGVIIDTEGRTGADAIWSNSADWIDYSGIVEKKWVGVTVMPDPENFRESWYHVRDYGLLTANPFGRDAMGKGKESRIVATKGDPLAIRFGIMIHSTDSAEGYSPAVAYRHFLEFLEEDRSARGTGPTRD